MKTLPFLRRLRLAERFLNHAACRLVPLGGPGLLSFIAAFPFVVWAGEPADAALVDDFANVTQTSRGTGRLLINDQEAGGKSQATQTVREGILVVEGDLRPGRGMPGFISIPLLLSAEGAPVDASDYTGVKLRVKITQGLLSVQVSTTDITNFDYHTSAPLKRSEGGFAEVRVPFADLRRAWSEQVPLNTAEITSINLVSAGMAPAAFAYEVDEVSFY